MDVFLLSHTRQVQGRQARIKTKEQSKDIVHSLTLSHDTTSNHDGFQRSTTGTVLSTKEIEKITEFVVAMK
ncbi:unnamed protein product [Clavelina lepadiformis]|uniref:Uncharacterized protein n=1 Tax=Clavelina lepadiformis TaxID=159417 RepID=A0ABP0FDU5_CLALP